VTCSETLGAQTKAHIANSCSFIHKVLYSGDTPKR